MPTYQYQCEACEHKLEEVQSFSAEPLKKCPNCQKDKLIRLISGGLGFSVKGGTSTMTSKGEVTYQTKAEALGMRYIPMDSAEQKFEQRKAELGE